MGQRFVHVTMVDRLMDLKCSAKQINGLIYRGESIPILTEIERSRIKPALRKKAEMVHRSRLSLRGRLRQMRSY